MAMLDSQEDHTYDILLKYFETMRNYEKNLEEFTVILFETVANIDDKFTRTGKKNKQDRLGENLKKVEEKTRRLNNEYEQKMKKVLQSLYQTSFAEELNMLKHNEYKININ